MAKYKIGRCRFFGTNKMIYEQDAIISTDGAEMKGMSKRQIDKLVSKDLLLPIKEESKPKPVKQNIAKEVKSKKKEDKK